MRHATAPPHAGQRRSPYLLGAVALGAMLFVIGVLAFVHLQTQHIFKQTAAFEVSSGAIPRNDGGILFGALLTALGPTLVLWALSPLEPRRRLAAAGIFLGAAVALLVAHFSIYVNGIVFGGRSTLRLRASFLFSDANDAQSIAVFILAGITLGLLGILVIAAMRLVTPDLLDRRLRRPQDLTALRTRTLLLTLLLLGLGAGFLRQFLSYAVLGDAQAEESPRVALVTVYYLLAFVLLLLLTVVGIRTYSAIWGNLAERRSRSYRRAYAYLLNNETWLWGALLLLNLSLGFFEPIYQPRSGVDRVFVMNSRGVSLLFVVLTLATYLGQRGASQAYMRQLLGHHGPIRPTGRDKLWWAAVVTVGTWGGIALLTWNSELSPLAQLILRGAALALILPLFAVRLDLERLGTPRLRFEGAEQVLLFAAMISALTGIMLWGIGNSVTTIYSRAGGFVTPEDATLQPYAVGLRLLGSIFLAAPFALALWVFTSRHQATDPRPLGLAAFSIIAGMNLLLTVDPTGRYDATIRQTDVLMGYRIAGLGAFDQTVMTIAWIAVAAVGFLAFAQLLSHGQGRSLPLRRVPR